jgi:hypothetical protein
MSATTTTRNTRNSQLARDPSATRTDLPNVRAFPLRPQIGPSPRIPRPPNSPSEPPGDPNAGPPNEPSEEPDGERPPSPPGPSEPEDFNDDDEDDDAPNLARAITLMTKELKRRDQSSNRPSRTKSKEPDTFDGTDPRKLNSFILQCNLYFRNNSAYSDDSVKVTFALSYLRGMALENFEPAILDSDAFYDWMDDWSAFVTELKTELGPIDPVNEAADNIDNLRMKDSHKILKYNVEFTRLAKLTRWDESALRHRYYTGLAERIKDVLSQSLTKPQTLLELKTAAHAIDARYWERSREKARTGNPSSGKSEHKSDKRPVQTTLSSHPGSKSNFENRKPEGKSERPDKSNKPAFRPHVEKLGKDGKLTQEERRRRFDNNLCMFCGGVGHIAKDCPKSTSSSAKARAAKVAEEPKK